MSETTCECGKPTGPTASLCVDCRHTLEMSIANVSAYFADLVTTVKARQVRLGESGRKPSEAPLGMDARFAKLGDASEVEFATRNTVSTWVREIQENTAGEAQGPACTTDGRCEHNSCVGIWRSRYPDDTVASMCRYLLRWSDWLRVSPDGPEALDELLDLEERLRKLVDRPAERWFAGPCGAEIAHAGQNGGQGGSGERQSIGGYLVCDEPLYARTERGNVECRVCGATYDIGERRAWLLTYAENQVAQASLIARAITAWGEVESSERTIAARIRQWGVRNRIFPVLHERVNGVERPLYRIGDVLDLLAEDARHADEKRERKAVRAR